MMVHCCTGLDLDRQDAPFFNDQQIGVQRGEVVRAFEIEVCPARERVAGERALPALARAHEEHGRKRPEEEPKTIGLLPLDIFHTVQFCMLGSKIQGMEIDSRFESRGLRLDVVAESEDNIGVDRLTACVRQRIVPEIVLEVYPPVIVKLHLEPLVGIHAGCRSMPQVSLNAGLLWKITTSSSRNMNTPVEIIDGTSMLVAIFEGNTIYRRPAGEAQP